MIRQDSFTGRNTYAKTIHVFLNVKAEAQCQDVSMTEKGLSLLKKSKAKNKPKEPVPASAIVVSGALLVENVNAKKIVSSTASCSVQCLTAADTNSKWE